MKTSVRQRIAIAMSAVLLANAAASGFSWVWYTRAARFADASRAATATARSAASVSQAVSRFMGDANGLAAFLAAGSAPAAATAIAATMLESDREVDRALARMGAGSQSADLRARWEELRVVTYGWIDEVASSGRSPLRIRTAGGGRYRVGVTSDLALPASVASLDAAGLRDAARSRAEALRDGSLRRVLQDADARAARAAASEEDARTLARNGTAGLLALSVLVAIAASAWIYRTIATPLAAARTFAATVAAGDLRATMERHSTDEIGELTRTVSEMKDAVVRKVDTMREMAGAVLVTADGVAAAASHAGAVARSLPGAAEAGLSADVEDVESRANTLVGLAEQMLSA